MYEEIPDLNLFMVCEVPKKEAYACLPEGLSLIHIWRRERERRE